MTDENHMNAMRLNFQYASKIRQYRKLMGMKQWEAAAALGCLLDAYCKKENGKGKLTLKEVKTLHDAFGKWRINKIKELQKEIDDLLSID